MAGPRTTRPSAPSSFNHDDFYSPLTNLVRKASLNHSSSTGGVPTYASLGMNRSTGQTAPDARPANMRSVSDQTNAATPGKKGVPPSLVLDREKDQAHQSHRRAQPSSPLLHTRFRASVATSIGSSSDLDPRDSQEVDYPFHHHHQHHRQQPSSASGSDSNYTPSPTAHRPFAYVVDDTHAMPSPTSQYSAGGPVSPNQPFQFDTRTSVAPSEDIRAPFQYDPRASSVSTDAPFQYDDRTSKLGLSAVANTTSRASNASYNPRGTWRSSNAPDPDPFSFRDYESPRVEPPIVVVHSPMSTIQDLGDEDVDRDQFYLGDAAQRPGSAHGNGNVEDDVGSTSYHDAYEYVYGAIEADDQSQGPDSEPPSATEQSFFAPEPTAPVNAGPAATGGANAGRVASVVAGGGRYNYSRPMRSTANGSVSSLQGAQGGRDECPTGASPGVGRSPLRQATGPLIFKNADEGQGQSTPPDRRSPSPSNTIQPPNLQYANRPSNLNSPQQPRGQSPQSPHLNSPDPQRPPSLYSQYSFYSLPNSTPPESPHPTQNQHQLRQKPSGSNLNPNNQSPSASPKPQSAAQQYLTRGITAHEQNNLRESARCFERSAMAEGGCGVGMLMWGLSLRHGWGCRKDERTGFKWLRRAAEAAVSDLESARSGEEAKAVRNELVLAIYEVGQCFFHGWGVGQDRPMAVSYFQVAARLGDCDAQQELAFCYLNGKGCKKDMKEAARWYRAAAAQGASTVGLAWIYKSKYT
ncbi:hypothetical protein FRC09_003701 [Ceratobasidium sp. 395]|nr:hypothetical protein FRC09_003701 [Ceratobasidium sp. 395]